MWLHQHLSLPNLLKANTTAHFVILSKYLSGMNLILAKVELINGYDLENASHHIIAEDEVKRMDVYDAC